MALSVLEPATAKHEPAQFQRLPDRGGPGREQNAVPAATDAEIGYKLRQAAAILAQGADPFRVASYRKAAESVLDLEHDLGTLVDRGGRKALDAIPGIGVAIASAIAEMLATGRWSFLEHLKGSTEPEKLFCSIPGLGPALARRVCEKLQIHTLEALEAAAYDGELESVSGFGRSRATMVRAALAEMLARVRGREAERLSNLVTG
jgi:DNA polymerase/3'-5' exonuclease PolX